MSAQRTSRQAYRGAGAGARGMVGARLRDGSGGGLHGGERPGAEAQGPRTRGRSYMPRTLRLRAHGVRGGAEGWVVAAACRAATIPPAAFAAKVRGRRGPGGPDARGVGARDGPGALP